MVCCATEYLSGAGKLRPIFPPYFTPSYSNLGFALLGAVIEAVTGKSYDDAIADDIIRPLNLTRTSVRKPQDDSLGIIPVDANDWEWDLGTKNPYVALFTTYPPSWMIRCLDASILFFAFAFFLLTSIIITTSTTTIATVKFMQPVACSLI